MTIEIQVKVKKDTKIADKPFSADAKFTTNGGSKVSLCLGRESMVDAIMTAIDPIMVMAPNAMQEEIDKCYERMDENPHLI